MSSFVLIVHKELIINEIKRLAHFEAKRQSHKRSLV